jgi:hypothetical protein
LNPRKDVLVVAELEDSIFLELGLRIIHPRSSADVLNGAAATYGGGSVVLRLGGVIMTCGLSVSVGFESLLAVP